MASRADALSVVVGGGPAGTAVAMCCARAGLDATLIERESFPRDRPSETLHPGVKSLLRELGVLERVSRVGFLRHEGVWVSWDNGLRFVPYGTDSAGPWWGFQAWRAEFDAILLERARELGVEVR